jgi:hypothetical protein
MRTSTKISKSKVPQLNQKARESYGSWYINPRYRGFHLTPMILAEGSVFSLN